MCARAQPLSTGAAVCAARAAGGLGSLLSLAPVGARLGRRTLPPPLFLLSSTATPPPPPPPPPWRRAPHAGLAALAHARCAALRARHAAGKDRRRHRVAAARPPRDQLLLLLRTAEATACRLQALVEQEGAGKQADRWQAESAELVQGAVCAAAGRR